ncbi:MAG: sulfatase-like hydrolase/transferase [Tissierellia bacterium]|nr:sulfatase-like hydrolase/transferase [Tissierellia bacterium]
MLLLLLLAYKFSVYGVITQITNNFFNITLISIMLSMVLISVLNNVKRKSIKDSSIIVFYTFVSILLFVDVIYFTYFSELPKAKMLTYAGQLSATKSIFKYLFNPLNISLIIDLPFVLIGYFYTRITKREIRDETYEILYNPIIMKPLLKLSIILLSFGVFSNSQYLRCVETQEFFTYHIVDLLDDNVYAKEENIEDNIEKYYNRGRLKRGAYTGVGKGKNLIVIQVEALQNFVIDREYGNVEITPNLNSFLKDDSVLYFDHYYQLVGKGNTSDAEFVTHNSLYPSIDGPSYSMYERNNYYGLPWALKDNGYNTWAFHGFEKDYWNRDKAYKNQGFDRFINEEDYDFTEEDTIGFGLNDEVFFEQSMKHIKDLSKKDEPFYAFMVTLTSHSPFEMPDEYKNITIDKEHEGTILGNYINSINYTDLYLGKFLKELEKEGILEDTVVAIYGDHFAINTDHTMLMTNYLEREYRLEDMMNIPLILYIPGNQNNKTISKVGSQLDFYPTIMNVMGINNTKSAIFGNDILNNKNNSLVASQSYALKGSYFSDDTAFIVSRDGIYENSEAYDLDTREKVDVDNCILMHNRALTEIDTCRYILDNNLVVRD